MIRERVPRINFHLEEEETWMLYTAGSWAQLQSPHELAQMYKKSIIPSGWYEQKPFPQDVTEWKLLKLNNFAIFTPMENIDETHTNTHNFVLSRLL